MGKKYYAVCVGYKPGLYTEWSGENGAEKQIKGIREYNQKKGYCATNNREEAITFLQTNPIRRVQFNFNFGTELTFDEMIGQDFFLKKTAQGLQMMQNDERLKFENIKKNIQSSSGNPFNYDMDLPAEVTRGLLQYLNVNSLRDLQQEQLRRLIDQSRFGWSGSNTDYHGRTDGYTIAYLPVNFYKIWLPLWKILEKNCLLANAAILEIGSGPGTSTWSVIDFYKQLALENPSRQFSLKYTAIERETDFSAVFHRIEKEVLSTLPQNLQVEIRMKNGIDAFAYMNTLSQNNLDLIIESNVLNMQESLGKQSTRDAYFAGLRGGLSEHGYAIFIEPGKGTDLDCLRKFLNEVENQKLNIDYPAERKVANVRGITLFHDAVATQIRYNSSTEHWFSYAILTKKQGER